MSEAERPIAAPASQALPAAFARLLFPDYNAAAIAYWSALVIVGAAAFFASAFKVAALSVPQTSQVLAIALIAAFVGMFPLRIPKSKNSIAAGDIFIFLLLVLHGPAAAVIAAVMEAAVCSWRTSKRWSSRIASPAAAAVAMLICSTGFELGVAALARLGYSGDTVIFVALMLFAVGYFIVSPTLVTTVIYLKRRQGPTLAEWLTSFGWLGMGYVASASIAGVLFLAFRQFGVSTVVFAAPLIAMFLTTLHYYFTGQEASERETAERASRERAEAAERESSQAAQHLRELELSDKRFHSAFTHAAIGMALVSNDGRVVQINRALCELLGRDRESLIGNQFRELLDPSDAKPLDQQLRRVSQREVDGFQIELRCLHPQGQEVWASLHCGYFDDASAGESHLIVQAFDVTARRAAEGRLHHLAYHDTLTNLANRSRLHDAVAQAIDAHRNDPSQQFSVMCLCFDRFKLLNESLGHAAGDKFLLNVAQRLKEHAEPGDVVARLGSDKFAILAIHRDRGTHHAITLAERLQEAFHRPFEINGTEVNTGTSIGITFSEIADRTAEEVLRDADLAMSKAKASGKERYALFDPGLHVRASERLLLDAEFRRGLEEDQLTLVFQPIFAIEPRRLVGFEALARWQHPERGAIAPTVFIPVAEESGRIRQLTKWAIQRACLRLRAWQDRNPAFKRLFVNVNISGHDLCEQMFADQVRETLDLFQLDPSCLTLEITENTLMQQLESATDTLMKLRELGVGLSVDDFGTGNSSLSHLSTLPISSLKIDRAFVNKLEYGSNEEEIVRAVIQLGHALGKRVVAEGIETIPQLDRLRGLGCKFAQGFLLSRPLSEPQVAALLDKAASMAKAHDPSERHTRSIASQDALTRSRQRVATEETD